MYTTVVGAPTTTTTTYVGAPAVYSSGAYGPGSGVAYGTTGYVTGGTTYGVSSAGYTRTAVEEIPVESRIEYIPFEKKYIEYDKVERIERVPYEEEIVEYEEVVRTERVPVERTITDYYAVETQV
jgi:hypothetical protein